MKKISDFKPLDTIKVTYQLNTWSQPSQEKSLLEVFNDIKGTKYKLRIEKLRLVYQKNDFESYKAEKLKLPAVTFCGIFSPKRVKENLKFYNKIIVLDIDKISQVQLAEYKCILAKDQYVQSLWTSPSNNGLKGLVFLDFDCSISNVDHAHKSAFYKLSDYFKTKYNIMLDGSGNDTTRLCFISYDEDIIIKNNSVLFTIYDIDLTTEKIPSSLEYTKINFSSTAHALFDSTNKNLNVHRKKIKDIILYLKRNKISITSSYENRYRLAYAISNSFTYDIGEKYFLIICEIEKVRDRSKLVYLLKYCYENNNGWTKFSYIEDLAIENGFKRERVV